MQLAHKHIVSVTSLLILNAAELNETHQGQRVLLLLVIKETLNSILLCMFTSMSSNKGIQDIFHTFTLME